MKVLLDENNIITSILRAGYIDGAVDVSADVPEDFEPYKYKLENGSFVLNEDYTPLTEYIDDKKVQKITESKAKLAEWLENNPIQYTDGKLYNVTAEKQSLLNGNLASYERAINNGMGYDLKWNATGEECVHWDYNDLLKLSLAIAEYVSPKVAMQQYYEIQIKSCNTAEDIENIIIDYN